MKNTLVLALVVAGLVFGYHRLTTSDSFDLAMVEVRPIPKSDLFRLWQAVALEHCAEAMKEHNLTPAQCREKVEARSPACARQAGAEAPHVVGSAELSKRLGRQYLACVTPYFFCKGVEVRTEAEAQQYCTEGS